MENRSNSSKCVASHFDKGDEWGREGIGRKGKTPGKDNELGRDSLIFRAAGGLFKRGFQPFFQNSKTFLSSRQFFDTP